MNNCIPLRPSPSPSYSVLLDLISQILCIISDELENNGETEWLLGEGQIASPRPQVRMRVVGPSASNSHESFLEAQPDLKA